MARARISRSLRSLKRFLAMIDAPGQTQCRGGIITSVWAERSEATLKLVIREATHYSVGREVELVGPLNVTGEDAMRLFDWANKLSRRGFLSGTAATIAAVAVSGTTILTVSKAASGKQTTHPPKENTTQHRPP